MYILIKLKIFINSFKPLSSPVYYTIDNFKYIVLQKKQWTLFDTKMINHYTYKTIAIDNLNIFNIT